MIVFQLGILMVTSDQGKLETVMKILQSHDSFLRANIYF